MNPLDQLFSIQPTMIKVKNLKKYNNVLKSLISGCRLLQKNKCKFIVMPCNTAHYWHTDIQKKINVNFTCCLNAVAQLLVRFIYMNLAIATVYQKSGMLLENKAFLKLKLSKTIFNIFMDQLNLCSATSSLPLIFVQPALSYTFYYWYFSQKFKIERFG